MRPLVRPGLTWAWRSPRCLQLGIDVPRPVLLTGLPEQAQAVLRLLDGTRTTAQVIAEVSEDGPTLGVAEMIDRLWEVGALVDGRRWPAGSRIAAASREPLMADLIASAPSDPDAWWTARARTEVVVVGASRLGAIAAVALTAAGVGRVTVADSRPVTLADVAPGGFTRDDIGRPRCDLLIAHPEIPTLRSQVTVDRVVHLVTDAVDVDAQARALSERGVPFLVTACRERTGRVGPFVDPGRTACHFCVQLHRRDHDPGWSQLWRQLTWEPSPVALATAAAITAQMAAAHIMAWCVGDEMPSMRGVVELDARDGCSMFHPTPPHPECGCTWPAAC